MPGEVTSDGSRRGLVTGARTSLELGPQMGRDLDGEVPSRAPRPRMSWKKARTVSVSSFDTAMRCSRTLPPSSPMPQAARTGSRARRTRTPERLVAGVGAQHSIIVREERRSEEAVNCGLVVHDE